MYFDFFLYVAFMNSIITVAVMSLDRFLYIYTPLKYELPSTKYIAGAAVTISVIVRVANGFVIRFTLGTTQFSKSL